MRWCKRSLIGIRAKFLVVALLLLPAGAASAGDPCPPTLQATSAVLAERIAAIACRENALWYRPFIDADGRLASMTVSEAETIRLADGTTPAWKRVADYWRGSGLLGQMAGFAGASECAYASNDSYALPACRAFLVDRPWSAAFVSFVMVQAGVPGFRASPSHVDYVRDAYASPGSPYRFSDPDVEAPAVGDLLCYVRNSSSVFGHAGLQSFLANSGGGLAMHCDIVVASNPGNDGRLYAVGGNVLQGTTMRVLHLNRDGRLWALPRGSNVGCRPDNEAGCNLSRQNWATLLKLRPLSPLPGQAPMLQPSATQQCCVNCVVGAVPAVPRCPAGPPQLLPPPGD